MAQIIAVFDFGSQYTQVIARRIRECQVYSKIYHYETPAAQLKADGVCGIILSGGPSSVFSKQAPIPDRALFNLGVPVLGICYGIQLMGHLLGGKVSKSEHREYGNGTLTIQKPGRLFAKLPKKLKVWNSHGDRLIALPPGFVAIGTTDNSEYAVIEDAKHGFYGIQFHPEVTPAVVQRWSRVGSATGPVELQQAGIDPETLLEETVRRADTYASQCAVLLECFVAQMHK